MSIAVLWRQAGILAVEKLGQLFRFGTDTAPLDCCEQFVRRDVLDEWGRPLPDDAIISWSLEAAFRAAGFSPQNPLGPELDD